MTQEEILEIFKNTLLETPGIKSISLKNDEQVEDISISEMNNEWYFYASVVILKDANVKSIIYSIGNLLRHTLKQKKEHFGKLNIFIGGLSND